MQDKYFPPTRKSILQTGAVKFFGPHQRLTCSGSVHAFHTSSRGASKVRVITSPSDSFFVAMFLFLPFCFVTLNLFQGLYFFKIFFECVEFYSPEFAVLLHPFGNFTEFLKPCLAVSFPAALFNVNQPALFKYPDMFGNCGTANFEISSNCI